MTPLQSISLLLTFAAAAGYLNHRWLRLPSAIGMTLMSAGFSLMLVLGGHIGLLPTNLGTLMVGPLDFQAIVLHGALALLLFSGALFVDVSTLRKWMAPIATLATVGVALSALITGTLLCAVVHAMGVPIPLLWCLVFGALIAPTDPLAALAVVRKTDAPPHLRMKLVGESLFNDGTGIVTFLILLALAKGQTHGPVQTAALLVWSVLGGAAVGGTLGLLALQALKTVNNYSLEIMVTLALATGSYALAEALAMSAPIATVMAGLMIGHQTRSTLVLSKGTKERLDTFWQTLDDILNAALFALMGLELLVLAIPADLAVLGVIAWGCVLAGRWLGVALCLIPFGRRVAPGTVMVLTWGGLRGGISLALALALPHSPFTTMLVVFSYTVVIVSALVQGTTLELVVRHGLRSGVGAADLSGPLSEKTNEQDE